MTRAISPVLGVVLVLVMTITLSATLLSGISISVPDPSPTASFDISADGSTNEIELSHHGGDAIDVSNLDVRVRIDGTELHNQPPVPFFAADGFESGPEGAFNSASDNILRAGEATSFRLAETNSPQLQAGSEVAVQITAGNTVIYDEKTTAT